MKTVVGPSSQVRPTIFSHAGPEKGGSDYTHRARIGELGAGPVPPPGGIGVCLTRGMEVKPDCWVTCFRRSLLRGRQALDVPPGRAREDLFGGVLPLGAFRELYPGTTQRNEGVANPNRSFKGRTPPTGVRLPPGSFLSGEPSTQNEGVR